MTKFEPLGLARSVIRTKYPADPGLYILYVINRRLHIARQGAVPGGAIVISKLSRQDINVGLTCTHWTRIETKILTLRKEDHL